MLSNASDTMEYAVDTTTRVAMTSKQMGQVEMKGQEAILSHPTNPQSTERTPKRKGVASSENVLAGTKMDTLGASGSVENAGNWPMNLQDTSERERKRLEQWKEKDSPRRTPDEPDGETAVPGGAQKVQERPTGVRDEGAIETNALCRETGPGGHAELQEASRDVKIDLDRQGVVEGAELDGRCGGLRTLQLETSWNATAS